MPKRETPRFILDYLRLIRGRHYPYYLIVKWFVDDAEAYYKKKSSAEVIYTLNPKWLHRELRKETKHEKLTVRNISRIIRAFLTGKKLEYYTTTTSDGGKSYHIELNAQIVKQLKKTVRTIPTHRINIDLPVGHVNWIDRQVESREYHNRSHVIESLIYEKMKEKKQLSSL